VYKGGATNLKVGGGIKCIGRWRGKYSKTLNFEKDGVHGPPSPPAPMVTPPLFMYERFEFGWWNTRSTFRKYWRRRR